MAIKKIEIRPKGDGTYSDVLYPRTSIDMVDDLQAALDNKSSTSHTHAKSDVGLGNVQNYDLATQTEAKAGTSNAKYMTPLRVREAINLGGVVSGEGVDFNGKKYTLHIDGEGLYLKEV